MVYLKLRGRKKSLEGRMQPAGRTLAMSAIKHARKCKPYGVSVKLFFGGSLFQNYV